MKRFLITTATTALFLVATAATAGSIVGSEHDFSNNGWGGGEICKACHAPHNNEVNLSNGLLWNHEQSTQTYILYAGLDLQGTVTQPTGNSKLCLSCHDGTVALDSYGGTTGTIFIDAGADFGTDLSNDHPISIDYNTLDLELRATSSPVNWADGSTPGTIIDLLEAGTNVECSSCHDVHNTKTDGTPDNGLLVVLNANSALCLTCHAK